MGQQASCTLHYFGRTVEGTAWLEHGALVFRGDDRLAFPRKDITTDVARDEWLEVTFNDRLARFDIGPAASKWADRIIHPPPPGSTNSESSRARRS